MTELPIKIKEILAKVKSLPPKRIPNHIAIIMDGNGRWANLRGLPRTEGHKAGISSVKRLVRFVPLTGVKIITLFTFSTENWRRPRNEIRILMTLLRETILKELKELKENGVKLVVSGDIFGLPLPQQQALKYVMQKTKNGNTLILNLALNYGGRAEIINAVKGIVKKAIEGQVKPEEIDENLFKKYLQTANLPDPDLLIRTSGEMRISNFLLWQIAYTELYFTPVLWPDFDEIEFCNAILDYASRERRFGGI